MGLAERLRRLLEHTLYIDTITIDLEIESLIGIGCESYVVSRFVQGIRYRVLKRKSIHGVGHDLRFIPSTIAHRFCDASSLSDNFWNQNPSLSIYFLWKFYVHSLSSTTTPINFVL